MKKTRGALRLLAHKIALKGHSKIAGRLMKMAQKLERVI